ncbi:MAG: hypothetical protein L0G22_12270 [Propionibacteriaceae bacterium]|nr:hypothetical protein [Propionibacteriaceae bacterium]
MTRTTIAIHEDTRARIKALAQHQGTTIDGLLRGLLDAHEQDRFWASFADLTPQSYARSTAADGDALDTDFAAEDVALDAEEA